MNAVDLFKRLSELGVVLTPHGENGLTVDAPIGVVDPPLSSCMRDLKSELRELACEATSVEGDWPLGAPLERLSPDHPLMLANQANWANIEDGYYRYLTAPRRFPEPCVCCGGRYKHSPKCTMMREAGLGVEASARRRR